MDDTSQLESGMLDCLNLARVGLGGRPMNGLVGGHVNNPFDCPGHRHLRDLVHGEFRVEAKRLILCDRSQARQIAKAWDIRTKRSIGLRGGLHIIYSVPLPDQMRHFIKAFDRRAIPRLALAV